MNEIIFKKQLDSTSEFVKTLPWNDKTFYADYLSQTLYFVRHSTRLLAKSLASFELEEHKLHSQFIDHLSEEFNHDKLIEQDLKALGEDYTDYPEDAITRAFYESQYYQIERTKGLSLLGYILYLELAAAHSFPPIYRKLMDNYGLKSSRFLKLHVEEDIEHSRRGLDQIFSLPQDIQKCVWLNYEQTAEVYQNILFRAVERNQDRKTSLAS